MKMVEKIAGYGAVRNSHRSEIMRKALRGCVISIHMMIIMYKHGYTIDSCGQITRATADEQCAKYWMDVLGNTSRGNTSSRGNRK